MTVRARLVGLAVCLLLLPVLCTGCGEDSSSEGADAEVAAADAGTPADAAASLPLDAGAGLDAAALPDAEAPDADLLPGEDASTPPPDAGDSPDAATGCQRVAKAADRARKVVLAHPYDSSANEANVYDILDLSASGELTQPDPRVTVTMGRAPLGEVVFTPDGEIGLVAQDDGTIGELRFDSSGNVEVLQTAFSDGFYADKVVMDPAGDRFYVLDGEWADIGGGVYSVKIGCDGALTGEGRIVSAKLPAAMRFMPTRTGQVFVTGSQMLGGTGTEDAHLLSWGAAPSLIASVAAFPDEEAIVSDARVMPDGRWALIADNAAFSGLGIRVAVVELQAGALRAAQILTSFEDPVQVVPSPYGNAALVVLGEGDGLQRLSFDSTNATAPFSVGSEVAYLGSGPQLPSTAIAFERGALFGRVFIAELSGIRQVQFETDGSVTDLGLTPFLTGYEAITGALGIQP